MISVHVDVVLREIGKPNVCLGPNMVLVTHQVLMVEGFISLLHFVPLCRRTLPVALI